MIKTIRNLIAALLLIGASHGAMAGGFESGNSLLTKCEDEKLEENALCYGYLEAVSDTFERAAVWEGFESDICMPVGVTVGQLLKIWIKWANEHPEDLHFEASSIVLNAYIAAFPCD